MYSTTELTWDHMLTKSESNYIPSFSIQLLPLKHDQLDHMHNIHTNLPNISSGGCRDDNRDTTYSFAHSKTSGLACSGYTAGWHLDRVA